MLRLDTYYQLWLPAPAVAAHVLQRQIELKRDAELRLVTLTYDADDA